jgi:hypothetical protein
MSNENQLIHIFAPKPVREGQVAIKMHHRDFEISMSLDDSAGSSDHLWRGDVRIYDRRVLDASHSSNPAKADVTIEFYGHNQGGETTLQGLIDAARRINEYYDRGEKYPHFPEPDEGDDAEEPESEKINFEAGKGMGSSDRFCFALSNGVSFAVMLPNIQHASSALLRRCDVIYNCAREEYVKDRKEDRVYWKPPFTKQAFLQMREMEYGEFVHRRNTGNWE